MLSAPSTPLSSRAVRQIPSTKRRGTAASDAPMRQAMADAQRAQAPMAVNPGAGLPTPSRRDNILAARADGTFDAKRDAYNKSGAATGHSMDEAGNITQQQQQPAGTAPWAPAAAQPPKPAAPTAGLPSTVKRPPAPRPTGGLIDGQPAQQRLAEIKTAQTQVPRQTAQNPRGVPAFQMPSVAAALRPPPVTRNVTRNVTPASPATAPVLSSQQTDAIAAQKRAFINNMGTSVQQMRSSAPPPAPAAAPLSNNQIMPPEVAKLALQHNPVVPGFRQTMASISDDAFNANYRATDPRTRLAPLPAGTGRPVSNAGLGLPRPRLLAGARADGGPVEAKKPYLVGEKGPEVVVPKTRSGAPAPKGWTPPAQPTPKVDFAQIARRHNLNPDGSDALLPAIAQALRHPAGNPSKILKDRRSFIAGRRADGGPVDKGKPYLVGERGPEVVIPDQPGTVIPNHAINPNADPGLSAMPPRPKATTAQPMVRQKVDGKNWNPSARPAAKAVAGNWRLPPPKIAPSLLVAR